MADHEDTRELPPLPVSDDGHEQRPASPRSPSQRPAPGGLALTPEPQARRRLPSTGTNPAERSSQSHSPPPLPPVGTPAIFARGGSASPIPERGPSTVHYLSVAPADTPIRPPLTASPTQHEGPDATAVPPSAQDARPRPPRARTTTNGHVSIMSAPPERDHGASGLTRRVSVASAPVRRPSVHAFNGTRDGYGHPYNLERRTTSGGLELPAAAILGDEDAHDDDDGKGKAPTPLSRHLSKASGKAKSAMSRAGKSIMSPEDQAALVAAQDRRIQLLLMAAVAEKRKCEFWAKLTSYALNIAIGLQLLVGTLTTALSVATSGRQTSIMTASLGGIATLIASYLARVRGSGEPEVSAQRVRDLEQFVRECSALDLDAHRPGGDPLIINVRIESLRMRFEEMLGNATTDRRATQSQSQSQTQSHSTSPPSAPAPALAPQAPPSQLQPQAHPQAQAYPSASVIPPPHPSSTPDYSAASSSSQQQRPLLAHPQAYAGAAHAQYQTTPAPREYRPPPPPPPMTQYNPASDQHYYRPVTQPYDPAPQPQRYYSYNYSSAPPPPPPPPPRQYNSSTPQQFAPTVQVPMAPSQSQAPAPQHEPYYDASAAQQYDARAPPV